MRPPPILESDYARHSRPLLARLLHACRLDKVYHRALGNRMWTTDASGNEVEVLDMVGGFGVGLLGHNHPKLVEVVRRALDEGVPFHAQGSYRAAAGALCRRLSDLAGASTGRRWVVTLCNTGTEAVEAAIKHSEMERDAKVRGVIENCRERHRAIQERLRNRVCRVIPRIQPGIERRLGSEFEGEPDLEEVFHAVLRHNTRLLDEPPVFLALEGAFHGKTTGSLKMTYDPGVRLPFSGIGIRVRFLPAGDAGALEAAIADATQTCLDLSIDAEGNVDVVEGRLVNVGALFIEPIQGEGGIVEVARDYLETARRLADLARFPLVFDEIQSGCGRTGTFLASEASGVSADYYTLSKALGGGLAKISALLVDAERYREKFGMVHTSTFAEDELACRVSLATLDEIAGPGSEVMALAREKGRQIREGLAAIKNRYGELIVDVRGRGLMNGIEFARRDDSDSPSIRVLSSQGYLGFAIAGYLLNVCRVRVLPTLSRPETIRIQPSAFLTDEEIERFLEGVKRVCRLLDLDRSDQLIRFLCVRDELDVATSAEEESRALKKRARDMKSELLSTHITRRRATRPIRPESVPAYSGRVSFVGHFIRPGHLRHWDPALTDFDDEDLARYVDRVHRLLDPFVSESAVISSVTGEKVHLTNIGIPITPDQMHRAFRQGDVRWVEEKILEAVRLARRNGSSVVGLGGYTSILTGQGTRIAEDRLGITSGNAMTVAIGVQALLDTAAELGLDLARSTLGALGATGNICSLYAQMMADVVPRIVLVGRAQMESRLRNVAAEIYFESFKAVLREPEGPHAGVTAVVARTAAFRRMVDAARDLERIGPGLMEMIEAELGPDAPIQLAGDPSALRECGLIVAASSTPEPVIYPRHLPDGPCLICDLAVPEDTSPEVFAQRPDVRVIRGGIVRLPRDPELVLAGVPLEPGHVFACMAETLLLGLSRTSEHFSWGTVTKRHVERIRDIARYNGFTLARPAMESAL